MECEECREGLYARFKCGPGIVVRGHGCFGWYTMFFHAKNFLTDVLKINDSVLYSTEIEVVFLQPKIRK